MHTAFPKYIGYMSFREIGRDKKDEAVGRRELGMECQLFIVTVAVDQFEQQRGLARINHWSHTSNYVDAKMQY